jgi:polyisoprenoid-binding protein YceI
MTSLSTALTGSLNTSPGASTWELDPAHSHVEFAVRHLMISTIKGRFADVQGTIRMDEADPSAVLVDATIGAASIDTRQEERDAHLRSTDFFDVARFPTIFFRSRRVQGTRSKATSGSSATSPSAKPRAR